MNKQERSKLEDQLKWAQSYWGYLDALARNDLPRGEVYYIEGLIDTLRGILGKELTDHRYRKFAAWVAVRSTDKAPPRIHSRFKEIEGK